MDAFYKKVIRHYTDFSGRASRDQYRTPMLLSLTFIIPFFYILMGMQMNGSQYTTLLFILGLIIISIFIPAGLQTKRLHDTGKSGWWSLIIFVPYIGFFILGYLLMRPSEKGTNVYGPNPESNKSDDSIL